MVGKAFLTKLFVLENETVTPFSIVYVINEDCGVVLFSFRTSLVLKERNKCFLCHEFLRILNPLTYSYVMTMQNLLLIIL